jgi:centromere protein C
LILAYEEGESLICAGLYRELITGRKTGLTVPDSGIRDEYGLEPMDDLFSSPAKVPKPNSVKRSSIRKSANATISSEEDMDVGESMSIRPNIDLFLAVDPLYWLEADQFCVSGTIPEPVAVLTDRKRSSIRMPIPKSKSPIKTFLQSPARRHPSLGPKSSPIRGSIISPSRPNIHHSVNRRLDFSVDDADRQIQREPVKSSPQKQITPRKSGTSSVKAKLTNGKRFSPVFETISPSKQRKEQVHYDYVPPLDDYDFDNGEDSYQVMVDDYRDIEEQYLNIQDESPENSAEPELESPLQVQVTKKRRRSPIEDEPAVKQIKAKSRSQNNIAPVANMENHERPTKKARIPPRKQEPVKTAIAKKPASKTAKVRNSSPPAISSPAEVQRGPPRPRNNRGLYILRREMPDDGFHTRSGRHVIKPVAYWKNETVVYGDDEDASGDASFLLPTIKEVIRKDKIEEPQPRRSRKAAGTKQARRLVRETESEGDEDFDEPWESEPGIIHGGIRLWNPEDPLGEESPEDEAEIAVSSAAIATRPVPNSTFKFAKTVSYDFFGAGAIDLPPGAIKKPKNSRKMHLVFFVFSGRVSVTVNDNAFRIGKGGMFQVPRGEMDPT